MIEFSRKTAVPILKGWSCDKKYRITASDGTDYLLRVTPKEKSVSRADMFRMQKKAADLGIPMCRPVEFGVCEEGVYSIQSWVDGEDAETVIPYLPDSQQYVLGLEAGRILKKIHSIPAPDGQPDWEELYNQKIDRKIKGYRNCPIKFDGAEAILTYIEGNRHLLAGRPQCFQHGDYHIGNMMLEDGKIVIIDFDRYDFGDPWEEFNRIVWCAQASPLFASGMVNGYFDGEPPLLFWKLLALYIASNTLSAVYWAIPFGQEEIDTMINQAKDVLSWYDNMQNPIPSWYFKGYYLQSINGLFYKLKALFDFRFLSRYGKVFQIFDDQDSGNICFGTKKEGKRYFIKFAGAPTERYDGKPEDAVTRLKATIPIYEALHHENLIEFLGAEEIGGGFAMIFQWVDGECMGRMYPRSHRKFMGMPLDCKVKVYADILSFIEYVVSKGYAAIDFYDGSILYDFERQKTTVCDIDLFRKMPCMNDMGRMWGSSRFMSPEEFQLGAPIDEITNVYTLGATAFALFCDSDRSREGWPLNEESYAVIEQAVSDDRGRRQQSVLELIEAWNTALKQEDL